ncbi:MAG TPA: PCRF domain-containing protein, partial [Candidatus Saccharimonadales bacterium]|nr:PCRF domain-containing protein [Candidatus Saccharimonadales bacterium]
MEDLLPQATQLQAEIQDATERLKLFALEKELDELQAQSQQPDFWQDNLAAQAVMKQIAKLEARVKPWRELLDAADELIDIIHLDVEGSEQEVTQQLDWITNKFDDYKEQLKLNGPYDDHDAILSIHAGAGGTDAQDWTQMLFRMYQRYAEKSGWQTQLIEESPG